jgi:hypothetical protein
MVIPPSQHPHELSDHSNGTFVLSGEFDRPVFVVEWTKGYPDVTPRTIGIGGLCPATRSKMAWLEPRG